MVVELAPNAVVDLKAAPVRTGTSVKAPEMALRAELFSAIAASDAARWGSTRQQLIMTLLEDRSCRLCAVHAEVLLRWRMGSNDAPFRDSLNSMQPLLLKAALAEDAASGGPVITASEPLTTLHNHVGPATPNNGGKPPPAAWGECVMQLQLHNLAAQLGIPLQHQSDFPYNFTSNTNLSSEGALPTFLFEYESPTSQADGIDSSSMPPSRTTTAAEDLISPTVANGHVDPHESYNGSLPPVTPVIHRNSAPLGSNSHSNVLYSPSSLMPSTAEVPLEVATCWGGGAVSMGNHSYSSGPHSLPNYSHSYSGVGSMQPPPAGGSYGGSRSVAGGPMFVPADMQSGAHDGGMHPKHTASGSPGTIPPQGGLRAAMAGCTAVPSPATCQQLGSPTTSLPPLAPERRPSLGRDFPGTPWGHPMNNPGGSALESGLLSSDGMPGSLPASSYSGSFPAGAPNWMNNPMMSNSLISAAVAAGGSGHNSHMSGLRQGPGCNAMMSQSSCALPVGGGPLSPRASQSGQNLLMIGLSSSLSGIGNSNGNGGGNGSLASPLCSPVCGNSAPALTLVEQRDSAESGCMPPSNCSVSDEAGIDESGSPGGGNMDLETALEAIINFESGNSDRVSGLVSAATAAAAHNTLQHHVAAAVRAAAAGFRPPTTSTSGTPANGNGGSGHSNDSSGPFGMSFAAVARMSADGGGHSHGSSMGLVGSAPATTMAALMQSQADARASAVSFNRLTLDASSGSFMEATDRTVSTDMSGMGGISAPRPVTGWASVAARTPTAKPMQSNPGSGKPSDGMMASSAPVGPMPGHAMAAAAAAARSMAAAVQQQQQQLANRGLNAFVAAASAKQQIVSRSNSSGLDMSGLPMLGGGVGNAALLGTPKLWTRLSPKLRSEVQQLLAHLPGIKAEELDDAVLYQLISAKRSDEDALSALRALDLGTLQQLAAFNSLGDGGSSPFSPPAGHGGRSSGSLPTSSKAVLQKLPPRVLSRLEEVVARCSYMDWKHFDAGVVKVMGQLSELSEMDVLEELQLLEATDLSNVEYMPAYLNKRLNNRLWSRRKAQQQHQSQQNHS